MKQGGFACEKPAATRFGATPSAKFVAAATAQVQEFCGIGDRLSYRMLQVTNVKVRMSFNSLYFSTEVRICVKQMFEHLLRFFDLVHHRV